MPGRILVVDDERAILIALDRLLSRKGYAVETVLSGEEAVQKLEHSPFHLVIADLNLKKMSGMDLLEWVKAHTPDTAVVMITAYGSEKVAVEAMKLGAADYLPKPFDNDELEVIVDRVMENFVLRRNFHLLQEKVEWEYRFENIIGKSPAMQRVFDAMRKVAGTDLTVLIRGDTGTGKELIANALHYRSPRKDRPFVKVNCAAFSRELVESELFGHEKGAFTGATSQRQGKFEVADGGTLFLDEIGDMSLETQAKILRVLQEREFERVGGNKTIKVDVRIIAATNQDLEKKVRQGTCREDLYYRLNVVPISLPPLQERREDIPLLINCFLRATAQRLGQEQKRIAPEAYRALLDYGWPGNVRELQNTMERAAALASGPEITLADLPPLTLSSPSPDINTLPFKEAKQRVIENFEREFIGRALLRNRGNISKTAEELGMYRQHLQLKLHELGLDPSRLKGSGD